MSPPCTPYPYCVDVPYLRNFGFSTPESNVAGPFPPEMGKKTQQTSWSAIDTNSHSGRKRQQGKNMSASARFDAAWWCSCIVLKRSCVQARNIGISAAGCQLVAGRANGFRGVVWDGRHQAPHVMVKRDLPLSNIWPGRKYSLLL